MSTVEERIVQMQFENADFQRGVEQTLQTLERLNRGLQLQGAARGLTGLATAAEQPKRALQNIATDVENIGHKITPIAQTAQSTFSSFAQSASGAISKVVNSFAGLSKKAKEPDQAIRDLDKNVESLASRFTRLGSIATGALMSIGARAQEAGLSFANSFTFGPITDGFREYETNMNSIQTILANTQAEGTKLKDVTNTLDELNHYSDQTIYNFSEMAKNIGTFTAAGVNLKTSAAAIKGIANLAALSGSNSEQASGAMYQLSQAIASGTVTLEDWNSVQNAGMGGAVFKKALADTAVAMGVLEKGAVKTVGPMKNLEVNGESFRNSISAVGKEPWLTSDVLTQTLKQFTGDMSDAELAAQGFSKEQIKAIQAQAEMAKNAATEVKTLSQLMGTFKEQLGSGWAQTWQIIFGDFEEAKGLFTGVSESIGGILDRSSEGRNKMLKDWDALGGRKALIDGISNAWNALLGVAKPIREAFREIFPKTTAKELYEMTVRFKEFTEGLKIGSDTADKLKRTFAGVFAIFGIVFDVVGEAVGMLFDLVGVATEGSGSFLDLTAKVGDFFVNLRKAIHEGDGLANFFKGLTTILSVPIRMFSILADALSRIFSDVDGSAVTDNVGDLAKKMEPMGRLGEIAAGAWGYFLEVLKNVWEYGSKVAEFFENMGLDIAEGLSGLSLDDLFNGVATGAFATLVLTLRNFLGGGGLGGIVEGITDGIDALTGSFQAMQNTLRAATLLQIAIAIGILAIALNTLSKIPQDKLIEASAGITVLFTQLLGALLIFEKFSSFTGFAKMPFIALSMILLASAVSILATAMQKIAVLDWNGVAKGLTGVVVLLGALLGVAILMPNPAGMISSSLGLILMATAINILATAVTDLAELSWEEMARGLVGIGVLLGALAVFANATQINVKGFISGIVIAMLAAAIKTLAFALKDLAELSWSEMARGLTAMAIGLGLISGALKLLPPSTLLSAVAILLVAASLSTISDALKSMSEMSWAEVGKGLTVLAGALGIIAGVLYLMQSALPGAAALIIVAASLQMIAPVLTQFGAMSWEEIGKGMTVLAGALLLIAGGLYLMQGGITGALALIVVAGALAILTPILIALGNLSWEQILTGLGALAGLFTVLGLAALFLTPVIPSLWGLAGAVLAIGAAALLFGAGILAAGIGVSAFAAGIAALAVSGAAGIAALIGIIAALQGAIPMMMQTLQKIIMLFLDIIIKATPKIGQAIVVLMEELIKIINRLAPKLIDMFYRVLLKIVQTMQKYVPQMVDAGLKLLTGVLNGIANNLDRVVTAAARVISKWLEAIGRNLPKVIESGVKMIISFINGVTKAIDSNSAALGAAGGRLGVAIIKGMAKGVAAGLGEIKNAAVNVAKSALDSAKSVLGINSPSKEFEKIGKYVIDGFRKGLDGNKDQIYAAFDEMKTKLKDLQKSSQEDATALEKKLKKLTSARKKDNAAIRETKRDLAQAKKEVKAASAAYTELTKKLTDERSELGKLAGTYDKYTEKIKAAQDSLNNAIKTRDDYNKSVKDQYSDQATPTAEISVEDYITNLKDQIEDTKVFANSLQRLRAMGLNDELYKDLIAAGPSTQPFLDSLLASGPDTVKELKSLAIQLNTAGAALAKDASTNLYQAGVDSAQGLLKGLESMQAKIEKQMDKIADAMVKAIKKKLGIKSPSRAFMEVGRFSAEGVAVGMGEMSDVVEAAAAATGTTAVDSLRDSLGGFSNLINGGIDLNPTITPVLDLSTFNKDVGQMSLGNGQSLSVSGAYAKARYASSGYMANTAVETSSTPQYPSASMSFTQNNYSPKSLSSAEIYRQTNNQLSKVKGALTTSAKQP